MGKLNHGVSLSSINLVYENHDKIGKAAFLLQNIKEADLFADLHIDCKVLQKHNQIIWSNEHSFSRN
jgi:hypothetical protein